MNKPAISVLSTLMNALFEGEVSDETVLFVLNNSAQLEDGDELQTMAYIFTCSASIAQLAQKYHSKESLKCFFGELGSVIGNVDDFLSIMDDATSSMKLELLVSLRTLPELYTQVIARDAGTSTLDSAAADLVIQSAINGMLMTVIERLD